MPSLLSRNKTLTTAAKNYQEAHAKVFYSFLFLNSSCIVITIRMKIAALEILYTRLLLAMTGKKRKNNNNKKKKTLKIHPKTTQEKPTIFIKILS